MEEPETSSFLKKHTGWRVALRAVAFIVLAALLFVYLNMVFVTKGSAQNRGNLDAFYDLEPGIVDVLYIGTSATSRLFINPYAYHNYGIASYSFGSQACPLFYYDDLIEEALETQDPDLIVIELRPVKKSIDSIDETDLRLTLDTISLFSPRRPSMAVQAIENKAMEQDDLLDLLFPISKYHSRLGQGLVAPEEFLLQGVEKNVTQGFYLSNKTVTQAPLEKPVYAESAIKISKQQKKELEELLDYCDTLDTDVLFVMSPFETSAVGSAKLLAAQKMVKKRGYKVLNCNTEQVTEEIGIDWTTDFYNKNHTNYLGAQKYTDYLCRYMKKKYKLPDRRGKAAYAAWEAGYEVYLDYIKDGIKYHSNTEVPDE